jgi:glucose/arabinose dehydrogenase
MPNGKYEVFADGFAGAKITPPDADHRPCGLTQGSDGSLYISDDQKGRIYKVTYTKK